jgi:hypothetical protein
MTAEKAGNKRSFLLLYGLQAFSGESLLLICPIPGQIKIAQGRLKVK